MEEKPVSFVFIVFWIVIFAVLVALGRLWVTYSQKGGEQVSTSNGIKVLTLTAGRGGHYSVSGKVNGVDVHFLVDTGASSVAIPKSLADKAGLKGEVEISVYTANGRTEGYLTRIDVLRIGPFKLRNVSAIIMSDRSKQALLGMSALRKLNFNQQGNQLILRLKKKK